MAFKTFLSPMTKLVKHEKASKAFGRDLFYTDNPMFYRKIIDDKEIVVHVPRGFLTDGASVPKVLQKLFPVWDSYYQAAVFHDYLCEYLTVYTGFIKMTPTAITRTEVDKLFNELMKELGINAVKRKLVNAGVVLNSHVNSIIYPSATKVKKDMEDEIRADLDMRDIARANQKK